MVSTVNHNDVEEIEALCKRAFDQMCYATTRGYIYNKEHIKEVINNGIDSPMHKLIKTSNDEKITGFMAVGITDFSFYSKGTKQAYEIVWHGDPLLGAISQCRVQKTLLKYMISIMDSEKVDIFAVSIDAKIPILSRLLESEGFKMGTIVYKRSV